MKYTISASPAEKLATDCLVVPVWQNGSLPEPARAIDIASDKTLGKIVKAGDLDAKAGSVLLLQALPNLGARRILLVGCGEQRKFDARTYRKIITATLKSLSSTRIGSLHFLPTQLPVEGRDAAWQIARLVQEVEQSRYRYQATLSRKSSVPSLKSVSFSLPDGCSRKSANAAIRTGKALGTGVNTARELGNLPGNVCTPSYLASECRRLTGRFDSIKTQVLSEKQMQRLGMGSLLSVSAGSAEEAKLIVMHYRGTDRKSSRPHVLVGKGITFDTGGISLKPGAAMDEMKFDMCGAASVVGALLAVAELRLPIDVVGIIPSAENMPGSRATKPGDVVTSMSGKTIEILNTDAEGRLVLCDALTYAERFKPRSVIDIATLTGAAVATFGNVVTALLSNDQQLADELLAHGQRCLDPAWQLPLWDEYQPLLDSKFADIANIGGPRAGTITAACFLSRFTQKFRWAHLDIAGSASNSGSDKEATGRPVSLLVEYLRHQKH